ncbi:MAG: hypothetical protein PHF31_15830 [Methylobacter sp.]|nr:hypothetical protein [Methylobacter sp.]
MNKPSLLAIFFTAFFFNVNAANAAEHHSGHGGGGGGSENSCIKPRLDKFFPPHLETAAPGSTFSFMAFNIAKPEQISVTVKTIPVKVTIEDKESFLLVKGTLPESLNNTVARVDIKVDAGSSRCSAEDGWLVKISD